MRKTVEYKKSEINEAGQKIALNTLSNEEKTQYLKIIDNWRVAHAFPMNTFAINLKNQVADIPGAIVVQRLKRLDTIIGKIKRYPKMELYRMQDLGGCRVIVPTVEDVYLVKKRLRESRIRHILHNEKDYIATPKSNTGYRGIHLVYRYKSEKNKNYNGLQTEIQIRTQLQHLWATAVETVGLFTQNDLKFNQGSESWLDFFKWVSALFSVEERSAIVEGVPTDPKVIAYTVLEKLGELEVIDRLMTIGIATKHVPKLKRKKKKRPGYYYLLILDFNSLKLYIEEYDGIDEANERYNEIETQNSFKDEKKVNVVLVSAQSFDALLNAYPNYFVDIRNFNNTLLDLIGKFGELPKPD